MTGSRALRRRRLQRLIVKHTPAPVFEYGLELLVCTWGVVSAVVSLLFTDVPQSLVDLLPRWGEVLWGINLAVGALLVVVGLLRRWYATAVPRGLQLLGSSCACYAVALVAVNGLGGLPSGLLMAVVALLCYGRAWHLQYREDTLRVMVSASR